MLYTRSSIFERIMDENMNGNMAQPVGVLHVLGGTNLGGAESRIMDLYRHIDRNKVQFDFLVHTGREGYFDKEIKELGGRIYRVPRFRLYNYFTYKKAVKAFFQAHREYQVIQGHMTSTHPFICRLQKMPAYLLPSPMQEAQEWIKGLRG